MSRMFCFQAMSFSQRPCFAMNYELSPYFPNQGATNLIEICGGTEDNRAVLMFVGDFRPYFYVACPRALTKDMLPLLALYLRSKQPCNIMALDILEAVEDAREYNPEKVRALRITLEAVGDVPRLRKLWLDAPNQGFAWSPDGSVASVMLFEELVWEADVRFELRFEIDIGAVPYCWLEVPEDKLIRATGAHSLEFCDVTLAVPNWRDIVVHAPEGEWARMSPVRTLCFDIECAGRKGVFPEPAIDPVCCVAFETFSRATGSETPLEAVLFTTGTGKLRFLGAEREQWLLETLYEPDASVRHMVPLGDEERRVIVPCKDERDMFAKMKRFIVSRRADHIPGYNSDVFDWPYLFARARALGIANNFLALNRNPRLLADAEDDNFQSKARGKSGSKNIVNSHFTSNDVLRSLQRELKLRQYTLNAVAKELLGEEKDDLHHSLITQYHYGTDEQQLALWKYNFQDVRLTSQLFFKRAIIVNQVGMARVTGVGVHDLITGGQQVKVHTLIVRQCLLDGYLAPTLPRDDPDADVAPKMYRAVRDDEEFMDDSDDDDNDDDDDEAGATCNEMLRVVNEAALERAREARAAAAAPKVDMPDLATPLPTLFSLKRLELKARRERIIQARRPPPDMGPKRKAGGSKVLISAKLQAENRKRASSGSASAAKRVAKYEGATVIEPMRGFYQLPITTQDFSSLYPSIMIERNLCYSTHVTKPHKCKHGNNMLYGFESIACGCVTQTPYGARFVTVAVREGLLPRILRNVLAARARVKAEQKTFAEKTDPMRYAVLEGRQLALKVTANSVYGFTGVSVGRMPCRDISASVTSYGRLMIEYIVDMVEARYQGRITNTIDPVLANIDFDATVVYGDTDSIMVLSGAKTVAEAIAFGKHAARFINALFAAMRMGNERALEHVRAQLPGWTGTVGDAIFEHSEQLVDGLVRASGTAISIVFEKALYPYLLIEKKRYVGGFYLRDSPQPDKVHQSGVESVRRDKCLFVSQLVDGIMQLLMKPGTHVNAVVEWAFKEMQRLASGDVRDEELIITRAYSKSVDDYAESSRASQPHLKVNVMREQREPGSGYILGSRIPYMYARTPELVARYGSRWSKKIRVIETVECPYHMHATGIAPFYEMYLENQVKKPIERIFDTIFGEGFTQKHMFAKLRLTARPLRSPMLKYFGTLPPLVPVDAPPLLASAAAAAAAVAEDDEPAPGPDKKPAAPRGQPVINAAQAIQKFKAKATQSTLSFGKLAPPPPAASAASAAK